MKNLKLFPKIFLYTLILMLLIAFFASGKKGLEAIL